MIYTCVYVHVLTKYTNSIRDQYSRTSYTYTDLQNTVMTIKSITTIQRD